MNTEKNAYELAREEAHEMLSPAMNADMNDQDRDELVDIIAKTMLEKVSAAYKEGFSTGTTSNGGLNIALKQVYTMMKHLDLPVKVSPQIGSDTEWIRTFSEIGNSKKRLFESLAA